LIHAVVLYQAIFTSEGYNLGFFNILSLSGWGIALLVLTGTLFEPIESLGIALFPTAALTILLALFFPSSRIWPTETWPQAAHIILSIAAYSLLSLAAVQAVLLAVQDYHLRHKRPGGFIRTLPPLQTMETLLFQMIATGLALLSLALFAGIFFIYDIAEQRLIHKTILSVLAWLVFATLLWGRWRFGWRGRTAIRWTLGGFSVLVLAYFGSRFVLEVILHRTWG